MFKLMSAAVMSAVLVFPAQAHAAEPLARAPQPVPMAFASTDSHRIWLADGTQTFMVADGGFNSWPKISPDRKRVAYVHNNDIWIAFVASGPGTVTTTRITVSQNAGGPSWSPHGDYLAYRALDNKTGMLTIIRVSSEAHEAVPGGIGELPVGGTAQVARLDESLRAANTVAWSPNGKFIAFPGGECFGIYDDCLTILELATNRERTVAAWGGGGIEQSGFATTPAWSEDSTKLFWTQQVEDGPLKVMGHRIGTRDLWQVGKDGDSQPVAIGQGRFLLVAANGWITFNTLNGRTGLISGIQPDWHF